MSARPLRPHVVVVGAGFAGLAAARHLAKAGAWVTLVERNRHTTFQPLLYQVATAGLNPGDISYPLRCFAAKYPRMRVKRSTVGKLRLDERRVGLVDGSLDYDYLVLATGVTTNWLGVPGARRHALPMYTVRDAVAVRERLITSLEELAAGRRGGCHVVIVGGGATGVEMAGTLAELRNRLLPLTHPEVPLSATSVTVVERFDHVLHPFLPELRTAAERALAERGVRLRLGATVAEVTPGEVVLADGTRIPSDVTIWAVGVTAPEEVADWGVPQTRGGRIAVTEALNLADHPEVFVAGDLAATPRPLPQLAHPAIQTGRHAARQIIAMARGGTARPLRYRDPGMTATIGQGDAVFQFPGGRTLRGPVAWTAWIGLHLVYLLGGRNRVNVLTDFLTRYAGPQRSAAPVVT